MRRIRSWKAAAVALSTTALLAAGGVQAQAQSAEGESERGDRPTSTTTQPGVEGHVTRVLFDEPKTLDEVTRALRGQEVLQLRYTGDVGGASQSGPGSSVDKAVKDLRRDSTARWGAEPLVFMAVVDGKLSGAPRSALRSAGAAVNAFTAASEHLDSLPKGTLANAAETTRKREAELAAQGVKTPDPKNNTASTKTAGTKAEQKKAAQKGPAPLSKQHAWSPVQAGMQAWNDPAQPGGSDHPRIFSHQFRWDSAADLAAFGDDFGYEHNVSLYNESDISDWTRPFCAPWDDFTNDPYENFWAGWDTGFKWNAVSYGWNIPGEAAPYWDWDDVTDSCQKLDFSIGIGYPKQLEPSFQYEFWIYAKSGDRASSAMEVGGQKLSNDCIGDPGSSCMGLDYDREGSGTEPIVNKDRNWTVPGCISWTDGGPPLRWNNGELFCPANAS